MEACVIPAHHERIVRCRHAGGIRSFSSKKTLAIHALVDGRLEAERLLLNS